MVRLGQTGPIRVALALAFVTFVPGWALLGRSGLLQGTSKVALAVATSLTLCTAAALAMAWLRVWHPVALFYGIGGVTMLALLQRLTRANKIVVQAPAPTPVAADQAPATPVEATIEAPRQVPLPTAPSDQGGPLLLGQGPRLTVVTVGIEYPARKPFTPHELPEFFARIHKRHPFVSFRLDGDEGALMETEGASRLLVSRTAIEYREMGADLEQTRRNIVDVLVEVQQRLGVHTLTKATFHLQARLDVDGYGSGRSTLLERISGIHRAAAALSSTGPVGVQLRFTGESIRPDCGWQVLLDPQAAGALIDLNIDFPRDPEVGEPAAIAKLVGEQLGHANQFLIETVVPFITPVASTPIGE